MPADRVPLSLHLISSPAPWLLRRRGLGKLSRHASLRHSPLHAPGSRLRRCFVRGRLRGSSTGTNGETGHFGMSLFSARGPHQGSCTLCLYLWTVVRTR